MTHRERIRAAVERRQPDRLPKDLGSSRVTGMVKLAYERLYACLGFGKPGAIVDRTQQAVAMDEDVLRYFEVDVRAISQNPPDCGGEVELGPNRYADEWGVVRRRPAGCHYYELECSPLCGEITAQDIARHASPDPSDPGRFRGLRELARRLREETDFAVMYNTRFHPVHLTQYLRGFRRLIRPAHERFMQMVQ